jgi:uncharacterized protein
MNGTLSRITASRVAPSLPRAWRSFGCALLAAALLLALPPCARAQMPEIEISIGGHGLTVEVAHTESARQQGLMHRRILPVNRGMLFVFPQIAIHSMWMMNTHIPLSVAFVDRRGVIINMADMEPRTQDAHAAAGPARYAIEVNQGWFRERGIKPGTRVEGLDRAPPPR